MDNDEFYRRCAGLLGTSYDCAGFPFQVRNRWNNRAPGHGRFPGFGIIRAHGDQVQVSLRHPVNAHRTFPTREEAMAWLSTLASER
jgi:hypothetical protein